jgi:hypothetical protein
VVDVYEGITLKEIQDQMRKKKKLEFGEIGKKTCCKHCTEWDGCRILHRLYCKEQICYFYDKKR